MIPPALADLALPREQRGPHLGHRGHRRDGRVDLGPADVVGVVDAVDERPATAGPRSSGASSTSSTSAAQGDRIVDLDAAMLGQPGHRAIQQAGVAEAVAELEAAAAPTLLLPDDPGPSSATIEPVAAGADGAIHPRQDSRSDAAGSRPRLRRRSRAGGGCCRRRRRGRGSRAPSAAGPSRCAGRRCGPGPIRTRTSRSIGAPTAAEHPPQLALPALARASRDTSASGGRRRVA